MNVNHRSLSAGLVLMTATILAFVQISPVRAEQAPDLSQEVDAVPTRSQQVSPRNRSPRENKRRYQPSTPDTPTTSVKIEQSWDGKVDLKLRSLIPAKGYVSNKADWSKLWQAYRGQEALPQIDFDREIVLVYAHDDPNSMSLNPSLTATGDLKIGIASTLMGFTGHTTCSYQFVRIKRDGIKIVGGQPLS